MRRRTSLAALAGVTGVSAGCAGSDDTNATPLDAASPPPSPTPTPTELPTPSPTPTPEPTTTTADPTPSTPPPTPAVERANLVWRGGVDDFVSRRAIDSAGAGGTVRVGIRAALRVAGGSLSPRFDIAVEDDDGAVVGEATLDDAYDVAGAGIHTGDFWVRVNLSDQPPGAYTGRVRLTDTARGRSTDPARFDFDLRDPLTGSAVSLRSYEPTTWPVDRPLSWTFRFANESDAGNSVIGDVRVRPADGDDWTDLGSLVWHLPPNRAVAVETGEITFERPGTVSFEIRPTGLAWSTELTG